MHITTYVCILFLLWGVTSVVQFHYNYTIIRECVPEDDDKGHIYLTPLLGTSVYSSLIVSLIFIYDINKKITNLYKNIITSVILTINFLSGLVLFVSFIIPSSYIHYCSKGVIITILITSFFSELFIFCLIIGSVILFFMMLHVIFIFIRELLFSPFKKINLKGICFGVVFAWCVLLIWSLISYEKDGYVWGLGIIQLFVCLCLMVTINIKFNRSSIPLSLACIFSITIFFLELFESNNGLTPHGIINILSLGFYPGYYCIKKVKKEYKYFMANKAKRLVEMPTEPPPINASGNNDFL